jgi:NAD(P)-dependent dehydrogenase (short-subunit alcohol dehydrogenase family)
MHGLLNGKVAIVTGGTSGIGLATVEMFVAEGAQVVLADIQEEAGIAIAARLGDAAHFVRTDVGREADIEALVAAAVERFGHLDVMHNNAGIIGDGSEISDAKPDAFHEVIAVNATSVLLGHKYAARQFQKQGTGGSIITTSSIAGFEGGWSTVGYTSAKHAAMGIMREAAFQYGPMGIRSNAIAPGVVMTAIQSRAFGVDLARAAEFNAYIVERMGADQAMGRFGMPKDIASVATFLASDLSAYVNGTVIPVDGGTTAFRQNSFTEDILRVADEFRSM